MTAMDEPRELPPPPNVVGRGAWVRRNLFNTWYNAVLTAAFVALLGWVAFNTFGFVFITARWEIIWINLTNLLVGVFPRSQLYRVWVAAFVLAAAVGLAAGAARRPVRRRGWNALRAATPLLLLVVTLSAFARTRTPLLLLFVVVAFAGGGWLVGRRLSDRAVRRVPLISIGAVVGAYAALTAFGGVGWDQWGGLLLTLFLAVGGIVLSFPLGVLLALGRRSDLPAVRAFCVAYIEFVRGIPLITVLLMGGALGFFLPPQWEKPSLVTRALVALIAFTAAYLAEVVRGGLQGVPKGQIEAAQAIGLSPPRITALIVLPQALRNVIPATVGQFISLFKDTSLVAIIGLSELLGIAQGINVQPQFLGHNLQAETLIFVSFMYWAFCYSMSRASQRLEHRLGVGVR
jgi:general L-amino acid transport system permease protein